LVVFASKSIFAVNRYIEITRSTVNVRSEPSTSGSLVAKAKRGDIFELTGEENGWFQIRMFSGKSRFIHKNLAREAAYSLQVPQDLELRKKVYEGWFNAERRAKREADRRHPPDRDLEANLEYQQLLNDRYKLEMMQTLGVQAPLYRRIILEGNQNHWNSQ
jgi:hypothetical protein